MPVRNLSSGQADRVWVVRSKLVPPDSSTRVVRRPQLEALFVPADRSTVTLVEAPAGYGKTTLLAQGFARARAENILTAWLTLDEDDRDPRVFLAYLSIAIAEAGIDLGNLVHLASRGLVGAAVEPIASELLARLSELDMPLLIALDDFHRCQSPAVVRTFSKLLERSPKQCSFAIASRGHPSIGIAKLRADHRLREVSTRDLRFTYEEGRTVLARYASARDIEPIIDRTEGWPVMLELLALTLQRGQLRWRDVLDFSGQTPQLAEYLSEQVLQTLAPPLQDVLLHTCILERMNGDIINALCNRADGWTLLDTMVNQGLFVSAIDTEQSWYRYHNLFSEFLRARLRREPPETVSALHRAAADWFAEHQLLYEAIRHANLAGDPQFIADLLTRAGGWLLAFRGGLPILKAIDRLPEQTLARSPYLRLGQIYLYAQEGKLPLGRQLLDELRIDTNDFEAGSDVAEPRSLKVHAGLVKALLDIYEGRPFSVAALRQLQDEARHVRDLPEMASVMLGDLLTYALYATGEYRAAKQAGIESIERCKVIGAPFLQIYNLITLAMTHLELGEADAAAACLGTAASVAEREFGSDASQALAARMFLAELACERGDVALASHQLEQIRIDFESRDGWFDLHAAICRTLSEVVAHEHGWEEAATRLVHAAQRLTAKGLISSAAIVEIRRAEVLTIAGRAAGARKIMSEPRLASALHDRSEPRLWVAAMLAMARLDIVLGRTRNATERLNMLIADLERRASVRWLIKALALLAVALRSAGNQQAATTSFRQALALASDSGLLGPIVQEAPLIAAIVADGLRRQDEFDCQHKATLRALESHIHGHWTMQGVCAPLITSRPSQLSPREQQILQFLADGLSSKEIAGRMTLSVTTVISYRKNLYRKLEASSRSQAIAIGRDIGYLRG